jgi:hypothetical protein
MNNDTHKNMIENSIAYSGELTVSLSDGKSTKTFFKNSGLYNMWNLLAYAVAGKAAYHSLPTKFCIYKRVAGAEDSPMLYSPIKVTRISINDATDGDSYASVSMTIVVTSHDRCGKFSVANDNPVMVAKLVNSTGEIAFAEIVDNDGKLRSIHDNMLPGIDAIYEWKLIFKNIGG